MLEARVKYILVHLGKLKLLIERIPGSFALGIPHLGDEENNDLGFHAVSHFFQVAENYSQVSYQRGTMTLPNAGIRKVVRKGLRL